MDSRITIVIADDHPLFRRGVREVLETDPSLAVIGEAGDGGTALSIIGKTLPMIAMLDIDMPVKGGLSVAREFRKQGLDLDVIFLTMYKEEELFNEAMDVGARGYVLKDSAVTEILNAVHAVTGGRYYISPAVSDHLIKRSTRVEKLLRHVPSLDDLTPAELRILRLIAESKTSKEIADELSISYKTVENHRTNIASKLHLRGSHRLLKFALENRQLLSK